MDPKAAQKFMKPQNAPILQKVRDMVAENGLEDLAALEEKFRDLAEELEVKLGGVAQPTRVALTGRTFSPGIFEVMEILGRDAVLSRLDRAIELCNS